MAKRSKRKVVTRKRVQKPKTAPRAQRFAALRASIGEGRARRALGQANELASIDDLSAEEFGLLASALTLRAREMLTAGQEEAAHKLLSDSLTLSPGQQQHIPTTLLLELECAGGDHGLLANYANDPDLRARVDDAIRRELRTPQLLAKGPEEHPLVTEAECIWRAWQELEAGAQGESWEQLPRIGRRSPFVHWRVFLQGVDAWYQGDTTRMEQNFKRISADSALAGAVCEVRRLRDGSSPASSAGEKMKRSFTAKDYRARVQAALSDSSVRRRELAIRDLYRELLRENRPALASHLAICFFEPLTDEEGFLMRPVAWFQQDQKHLIETHLFAAKRMDEHEDWLAVASDLLAPLDLAIIWRHVALSSSFDSPEGLEECFQESIRHAPLPHTFRLWYEHTREHALVLEAWLAACPEDTQALVFQLLRDRKSSQTVKARAGANALRELGYNPAELDRLEPLLAAEDLLVSSPDVSWSDLLSRVSEIGEEDDLARLIAELIILVQGRPNRRQKTAWVKHLVARQQPAMIVSILQTISQILNVCSYNVPKAIRDQFSDKEVVYDDLLRLLNLRAPVWMPDTLFDDGQFLAPFGEPLAIDRRIEMLDALWQRCLCVDDERSRQAMFLLTRLIHNVAAEEQPVYLVYRGAMLSVIRDDCYRPMVEVMAAAARTLAASSPHRDVVTRIADNFLSKVDMSPTECQELIADLADTDNYYRFIDFCLPQTPFGGFNLDFEENDFAEEDDIDLDDVGSEEFNRMVEGLSKLVEESIKKPQKPPKKDKNVGHPELPWDDLFE